MASIRKKGRGYEARVKIHGTTRSKSFATMQQARVWARSAELDISGLHGLGREAWRTAAVHPAWQAQSECVHRTVQQEFPCRDIGRKPVQLDIGGAGCGR